MKERKIVLVRHGKPKIEGPKRYIGQYDIELSETGIKQAENIGNSLKKMSFEHIFCSPLKRTTDTANIICSYTGGKVEFVNDFKEIHLGDWENCSFEDIRTNKFSEYDKRGKDIINYRVSGGESFLDLYKRVIKGFNEVIQNKGNILIVAHAGVNRMILCEILGIPLTNLFKIRQDYGLCSIINQNKQVFSINLLNGLML